jgi:DNA-directed RNA polymerase specialized sigma24 family protein
MDRVQLGSDRVGGVDDIELAREAAYGNGSAFRSLYERYSSRVYTFCFRLLGDRSKAQEATEQAFVKTATKLTEVRRLPPNDLSTQLYFHAYHASLVALEGKSAYPGWPASRDASHSLPTELTDSTSELGWQERIWAAHGRLGIDQRAALCLATLQRPHPATAGSVLHLGTTQASRLLSTARIALASDFQGHDPPGAVGTDCQQTLELLAISPHRGDMEPHDRSWLDKHTGGCPACAESLRLAPLGSALSADLAWELPPPSLRHSTITASAQALGTNWASAAGPVPARAGSADTVPSTNRRYPSPLVLLGKGRELVTSRSLSGKGATVSMGAAGLLCAGALALALVNNGHQQAGQQLLPPAASATAPSLPLPPAANPDSFAGLVPKPTGSQASQANAHHPPTSSPTQLHTPTSLNENRTDHSNTSSSQAPVPLATDTTGSPRKHKKQNSTEPPRFTPNPDVNTGNVSQTPAQDSNGPNTGDQTNSSTPSKPGADNTSTQDQQDSAGADTPNPNSTRHDSEESTAHGRGSAHSQKSDGGWGADNHSNDGGGSADSQKNDGGGSSDNQSSDP